MKDFTNELIEVDVSGTLATPLGEFTALMFFSGFVQMNIERKKYEGFPYEKDQKHGTFFCLKLSKDELKTFLDATKKKFASDINLYSFVERIEQVIA